MNEYVIIGNGVAAVGCIEGIRSVDREGKITVVSEENHAVYCRPLISYYLEGKTTAEKMNYRKPDFYKENGCEVIYGKKAVEIDKNEKTVLLDDGTKLAYTSVCVATGSSPFVPKFEGLYTVSKKFAFMTMDDMLDLEKAVNKESRVLIVGAGLIGLKCAEGLKERVQSITVCDLADRVLSSILDSECAAIVQAHLEANGIEFLLSDSVETFDKNTAKMKSGKTVDFDVAVLAVGVRANTALVSDLGGEVNRGILVDDSMKTSVENIYAAGDCTEGNDVSSNTKKVIALVPNAYMQGKCAGKNMAGESDIFDKAVPMNAIGFFGLHMLTAGTYYDESQGGEVYKEESKDSFKKLFSKDGFLTGFIMIGETDRAGIYTSMIRNKIPLDSVNFDLLKKSPTTLAFSKEERERMFKSVV